MLRLAALAVVLASAAPLAAPQEAPRDLRFPAAASRPASPPQVEYRDGLLSITAHDSELRDILAQVRALTGATIESPPGGPSERVVVRLGPAPADQVLDDLLHGSRFDYIILGSARQPGAIERVILTHRGPPPTAGPIVHARGAFVAPEPPPETGLPEDGAGDAVPPPPPVDPEPEPAPATPAPGQPYSPGRPIGDPATPRTPEELLRELQRLRHEQQQQQLREPMQRQFPQPGQDPPND